MKISATFATLLTAAAAAGLALSQSGQAQSDGTENVSATVRFENPQAESRLKNLLEQHNLKPFAVFMSLDGHFGRGSVKPEKASVDLIDTARKRTVAMEAKYGQSLAMRAERAKDGKLPPQATERIAKAQEDRQRRATSLQRGKPIIYGLWVIGRSEDLKRLDDVPGVTLTPSFVANGQIALADPEPVAN